MANQCILVLVVTCFISPDECTNRSDLTAAMEAVSDELSNPSSGSTSFSVNFYICGLPSASVLPKEPDIAVSQEVNVTVDRAEYGIVKYYVGEKSHDLFPAVVFVYDPSLGADVLDDYNHTVVVSFTDKFPSTHAVIVISPKNKYTTLLTELLSSGTHKRKELIILSNSEMQAPLSILIDYALSVNTLVVDMDITETDFLESLRKVLSRSDTRKFVFLGTPVLLENITSMIDDLMYLVSDTVWLLLDTKGVLPLCASCGNNIFILKDPYLDDLEMEIESVIHRVLNSSECLRLPCHTVDPTVVSIELKRELSTIQHAIQIYQSSSNGTFSLVGSWDNATESSGQLPTELTTEEGIPILRVVSIHDPPYTYKVVNETGTFYTGYAVDLLHKIAEASRFRVVIEECTIKQPFIEATVFAWSECIEDVVSGKADMVIGPLSVTKEREMVVDFILPYVHYNSVQMLTRANQRKRFDFLKVFDYWSMIAWFGCFVFTSFVLWIYQNIVKARERKQISDVKYCSLQDVIWFIITKAEFECEGIRMLRTSTKLMSFGFWLLSFILMSAFTANLASFMTVYRLDEIQVNKISDLVNKKDIKYSVVWGSDEMVYFENMMKTEQAFHELWKKSNLYPDTTTYPFNEIVWDYPVKDVFTQLWQSMKATGFFNSTEEALEMVYKGNFIFLSNTETVKYITSTNCATKAIGSPMGYRPIGFILRKESRLYKTISNNFMEIQQSSAIESLRRKWWENGGSSCGDGEIVQEVKFAEIAFWFLTPVVGIALGLMVLGVERIVSSRKDSKSKRYSIQNGFGHKEQNTVTESEEKNRNGFTESCSTKHLVELANGNKEMTSF